MPDNKRKTGTQPLPALGDRGDERGEDPSSVTADWYGQEVSESVDQAADARQGLEDDLSRLLGSPGGREPRGSSGDDVAFAPTQELGVIDDTAPALPAPRELGLATELRPNVPPAAERRPAPDPTPRPPPRGRGVEGCDEEVVFSEEQRQQLEEAIRRQDTAQQALARAPSAPVTTDKGGSGPLVLILIIAGLVAAAVVIGVHYLA